ncbi:AAA family ATPase [Paenibacillus sp. FSL H8-0122]|uniref:chloramphenicol phosphotransferase CPT family protein n=2 Tax=Paenibacillus sp. FSL H8-0122 TaxID=2954510 RepID=UPI0030FA8EF6
MNKGMLLVLNGTSSSGKSSISAELTKQKEIPFYHVSIDDFFMNYNDFINHKFPDEPVRQIDHQVVSQILDDSIVSVYYSTIKLLSEMGFNVIVDTVFDNDKRFNEFWDHFADRTTLFIGVLCSREELIRREQARGDRQIGLADAQFDIVYRFDEYDLEVNTEELTPAECAEQILNYIKSSHEYSVFQKLRKRDADLNKTLLT